MAGVKPMLHIIDEHSTPHAAKIVDENGADWAKFCRKAVVTLDVNDVNFAVLEMVGPGIDVIAELREVRIVTICDRCAEETELQDVTTLPDSVRRMVSLKP